MLLSGQPISTTPISSLPVGAGSVSVGGAATGVGSCAVAVSRLATVVAVAVGLGACTLTGAAGTATVSAAATGAGTCALIVNTTRAATVSATATGAGSCALDTPFPRGSFTAAILAEKNKNDGVAPTCLLKFDFATDMLFVGAHEQTIAAWDGAARAVKGWVFDFGRFDDVVGQGFLSSTPVLAGDVTMSFWCPGGEDGTDSLWSRLLDPRNQPEKTVVRFYRWWRSNLSAATDPPVQRWEGTIRDWKWINEDTLSITFGDPTERLDRLVGTPLTRDNAPNVDSDDLGTIEPIVYGDVPYVPARARDAGPNSTLAFDMTAAQTVAYYSDTTTTFAGTGTVYIGQEECPYVGTTTEVIGGVTFGKLTNLTRGANGTTAIAHKQGGGLIQKQAAYIYEAAGHPCYGVPEVYVQDVSGELVLIDPATYNVNLNNGGITTVTFTTPPRLVRGGAATGVADTIAVTGGGEAVNVHELPTSITPGPTFKIYPNSAALVTFPSTAVVKSQIVHLGFSTFTVSFSVRTTITVTVGTTAVTIFDSNVNAVTPADVVLNIPNVGDTVTFGFGAGDANSTFNIGFTGIPGAPRPMAERSIFIAAPAVKSGTVALSGNSAADVLLGGRIFCRVQGYKDDAQGTYTGTPNALIQNTRDAIKHFCVTYMGYAPGDVGFSPNLAAKMGSTYQCNGAIHEQGRARTIRARMAFESGCWVKDVAGLVTLMFRERYFQPAHVLHTSRLVFLDGNRKTADRDRLKVYETINRADVRYARDYTQPEGEGAYLSFVRKEDTGSQARYGLQENPDNLRCNWIRTDAHAAALAQFIVDVYGPRRPKVKVRSLLHHIDIQFGDRVRLQDRMQKYLPAEVISVDHQPEHAVQGRIPLYDFTLLGIEEAEAMLQVQDKTANYTLTAQDQHQVFRNTGAAGTVVLTLPPAVITNNQVLRYGPFVVDAAQAFRISPAGTDKHVLTFTSGSATDKVAPAAQAASKYLGSSTQRAMLWCICVKTGEWLDVAFGTWVMEA